MAGNSRDVELNIVGKNKAKGATDGAARDFEKLAKRLKSTGSSAAGLAKGLGKTVSTVAALGSAGITAATGTVAVTKAAIAGAHALAAYGATLGPVVTGLPALAAGLFLVKGTLASVGPAYAKALSPISKEFERNQRDVDRLATRGLPGLARSFNRVNTPVIGAGMERIARATDRVVVSVGKWVNSAAGQRAVRTIVGGTASAVERLAPHVAAAAVSFGNLVARAGDPAISRLGGLLGAAADRAKRLMDSISSAKIDAAWRAADRLGRTVAGLPPKLGLLHQTLDSGLAYWDRNQAAITRVHTALVGVAVIAGLLSGNWLPALIASGSLLATNWQSVGSVTSEVLGWFGSLYRGGDELGANLRGLVHTGMDWGHTFMDVVHSLSPVVGPLLHNLAHEGSSLGETLRLLMPVIRLVGQLLLVVLAGAIGAVTILLTGLVIAIHGVNQALNFLLKGFGTVFRVILNLVGGMLNGLGEALSHIPGPFRDMGQQLKIAAGKVHAAAGDVQAYIDGIHGKRVDLTVVTNYKTGVGTPSGPLKVGYRAGGGRVQRDRPYVVGEHAPELFVPDTAGRILNGRQTSRAMAQPAAAAGGLTVVVQAPVVRTDRAMRDIFVAALVEASRMGVKLPAGTALAGG